MSRGDCQGELVTHILDIEGGRFTGVRSGKDGDWGGVEALTPHNGHFGRYVGLSSP